MIFGKLTGIKEIEASLERIRRRQDEYYRAMMLNEAADHFVSVGKTKAHKITGNMADNIDKENKTKNSIDVIAKAEYSEYENRRRGSKGALGRHNFMDQARDSTKQKFPSIVIKYFDANIRENKARTPQNL